ncbi:MAG: MotA/TolQ/ExbB proton channel family protein [Candidatus Firestonebacteria bacterium]|nr:MotA/TolQ/ExbB proton channel family protein [Candidatus Firestonebacteria bacterium]
MNLEINIVEVLRTSFTLWILIFCSVMALGVALERWWCFRKAKVDVKWFTKSITRLIDNNQYDEALVFCDSHPSPFSRVMKVLLGNRALPRTELDELADNATQEERMKFEKMLGVLGTLGSMSPFIGLFGTVVGIIRAFHQLAVSNAAGGASTVAAGISEALVATAAGLFVAIPCIVLFNYFSNRIKKITGEIEVNVKKINFYLASKNSR